MISVLLVDDHPVVIEGLRKVLATAGDLTVTGEAHDASGAIETRTLHPDVVLLDLRMPAPAYGRRGSCATWMTALPSSSSPRTGTRRMCGRRWKRRRRLPAQEHRAGEADRGDSLRGPRPSPARPRLLDGVLLEFGGLAREQTQRTSDLSSDDLEIPRRASKGSTNREIGLATGRTEVAVKKRLQVIFQKLGAVDRAHAVAEAIRRGLI